jgi:hypothetical protein
MSRPLDLVVDGLRRLEAIIELVAPMIATCLLAVAGRRRREPVPAPTTRDVRGA